MPEFVSSSSSGLGQGVLVADREGETHMEDKHVISDHAVVLIWAAMVGLGQPTVGHPTVAEIRAELDSALEQAGLLIAPAGVARG